MCLSLLLSGCQRAPQVFKQQSFVFGTVVELTVAGDDEAVAKRGMDAVLQEFDRLHRLLHPWEPSESSRLNDAIAKGQRAPVGPELAFLLQRSQDIAQRSDGLFDPGIGQLVRLWGFHSDEFKPVLPDPVALARLLAAHPSMRDVQLQGDQAGSRNPAVRIDLGGIAKGYALDRARVILLQAGVRNALVNIGGNIIALGNHHGAPWKVGVRHPRQPGALFSVELADGEAIGTSGDYQRFFELDGKRYSHLLDPRTGHPVTHTQALTLIMPPGPDAGLLSDALSKPLYIAGDAWRDMAARLGVTLAARVDAAGRLEALPALTARMQRLP